MSAEPGLCFDASPDAEDFPVVAGSLFCGAYYLIILTKYWMSATRTSSCDRLTDQASRTPVSKTTKGGPVRW